MISNLKANKQQDIPGTGTLFVLRTAASEIKVMINNKEYPCLPGESIRTKPGEHFTRISMLSTIDQQVDFVITFDEFRPRSQGNVNASITPATGITPQPVITLTAGVPQTLPANASRKRLQIKSDSNNPALVFLNNDATKGLTLDPGESYDYENTAALDLFCASAATLYWHEET